MKIAYVSDAIYPYNKGGKEKRLYDISTRLAKMGHDVHIYCMKWWKGKELHRFENGVHLHAISPYYPLYSGERRSIKEGILFGLACLKLIKENWDVIDVDHMPFFPIIFMKVVCVLKGKKMIATWHEVWGLEYWKKYLGWKGYLAFVIEKFSVFLPDHIISITDNTTRRINTFLGRKNAVSTVLCGVDAEFINRIISSKQLSDIIFAGRLLSHKNIDLIIKAVSLLKTKKIIIKAFIIGDGPEKRKLVNLTNKLNLDNQIKFIDFLPKHEDVLAMIKSSRLFVFPSEREGFGLVAIEANACGIPFITSNHIDNFAQYLIDDKNGFACDLNEMSLSESILKNLDHNSDKYRFLNAAKKYDWKNSIKDILNLYSL